MKVSSTPPPQSSKAFHEYNCSLFKFKNGTGHPVTMTSPAPRSTVENGPHSPWLYNTLNLVDE
jgi:hypothetical protein